MHILSYLCVKAIWIQQKNGMNILRTITLFIDSIHSQFSQLSSCCSDSLWTQSKSKSNCITTGYKAWMVYWTSPLVSVCGDYSLFHLHSSPYLIGKSIKQSQKQKWPKWQNGHKEAEQLQGDEKWLHYKRYIWHTMTKRDAKSFACLCPGASSLMIIHGYMWSVPHCKWNVWSLRLLLYPTTFK